VPQQVLDVAVEGAGSVKATGAGISCPSTCSSSYPEGEEVTLTATPDPGSTFTGWGGACAGIPTNTCTVTMSKAMEVTAAFAPVSHHLLVSLEGTGSGTVGGNGGISCPGSCSASYIAGTEVTLTATPAAGSAFAGWSGACSGTGVCHLKIAADTAVAATFAPAPPAGGEPGAGGGTAGTSGGASTGSVTGAGTGSGAGTAAKAGPTPGEILARLLAALTPRGRGAKIGAILRAHAFTETLTALEPGTATVSWFALSRSARLGAKSKPKRVLVAIGGLVFATPGTGKLELVLTTAGQALLRHSRHVSLSARSTFAPLQGQNVTARAAFSLRR
ncbi:MAG TPA: hypothetical protein VFW29_07610, partial [Solirubrobacteraceae bacterium]|nr:hypothetical protein [Solirubrobacteraceae bacterium]